MKWNVLKLRPASSFCDATLCAHVFTSKAFGFLVMTNWWLFFVVKR